MNPFDSDLSDSSVKHKDSETYHYDSAILEDCTQSLGLQSNYVPKWQPPHAIREYHQNWMDAINETSKLKNRRFKILDKGSNSKNMYTIEARHPDNDKLLGFISWQNGTVEYTNFGAKLERKTLSMGASSKRNSEHSAGTHGEGFKLASLVMLRCGYRVRFEASSFYWNFSFGGRDKDLLSCRLSSMKEQKITKQKAEYTKKRRNGRERELKANIWEDVTVKIGEILGKGTKVKKEDFLKWIKVSLDLDPPSKIITTQYGRLILDKEFMGRTYLKSLLLEGENVLPIKFCYDFYQGQVNRDRQRLSSPKEEAKTLAHIWDEAIKLHKAAAVPELLGLLQDKDKEWGDVNLIQNYMLMGTARKIWQKLVDQNVDGKLFYYFDQNGDKDIELITKSLHKEPAPLKKATWLSLRRFELIKTPEEQRCHLLKSAPDSAIPNTAYSEYVKRALRSVLALDPRTRDLQLDFRSGANAELDVLLQTPKLLINDKWLDFLRSHEKSSCSVFIEALSANIIIERFSCGHIMKSLHDLILVELSKGADTLPSRSAQSDDYFRLMVSERIDQVPFMVKVIQGDGPGVLEVSWVHPESEKISRIHHLELKGQVILHRDSTCADKREELLASDPSANGITSNEVSELALNCQQANDCGCPRQIVLLKDSRALFYGLDHEEQYFPMVSRTDPLAFFALPPNAISPLAPLGDSSYGFPSDRDDGDLYGVSSSEKCEDSEDAEILGRSLGDSGPEDSESEDEWIEDEIVADGPVESRSSQSSVSSVRPPFKTSSKQTQRNREIMRLQQQIKGQRRALPYKDIQLRDFADEKEGLLNQLSLKDELRSVRSELDLAKSARELLQNEVDTLTVQIQTLEKYTRDIERLQSDIDDLEAELILTRHRRDKQAQLAANNAAKLLEVSAARVKREVEGHDDSELSRYPTFTAGVKRETKDEDDNGLPRRPTKVARRSNAITTGINGIIELD